MNFTNLFKLAKEKGIEDIQVYYSGSTEFDIEVLKGSVEKYAIADSARLSVKGIYKGKTGFVMRRNNEKNFSKFPIILPKNSAPIVSDCK